MMSQRDSATDKNSSIPGANVGVETRLRRRGFLAMAGAAAASVPFVRPRDSIAAPLGHEQHGHRHGGRGRLR
jgi:hypothetical protein